MQNGSGSSSNVTLSGAKRPGVKRRSLFAPHDNYNFPLAGGQDAAGCGGVGVAFWALAARAR